jgi:hypothetical protein
MTLLVHVILRLAAPLRNARSMRRGQTVAPNRRGEAGRFRGATIRFNGSFRSAPVKTKIASGSSE